jgi:hypothetical protein
VIDSDGRHYNLVSTQAFEARHLSFAARLLAITLKLEEVIERLTRRPARWKTRSTR